MDQTPENTCRAGFFFIQPSREAASSCRSLPHLLADSLSCLCQVAEPLLTSGLSTSSGWERRKRRTENFPCCAPSGRFARCHGWSALPLALRQQVATSLPRLHKCHAQCLVRTHKVILGSPPLEVSEQVWRQLCRRPRATGQCRYAMADGQIHPLDKCRGRGFRLCCSTISRYRS